MATAVTVLSLQRTKIKIQYFTIRHPVNRPHPQRLKLVKLSQSNNCIMNSLSKLYAWRSQRQFKGIFDLIKRFSALNLSQFNSIIIFFKRVAWSTKCAGKDLRSFSKGCFPEEEAEEKSWPLSPDFKPGIVAPLLPEAA